MSKILLVEDDEMIRNSLKEALIQKDYEVIFAINAKEGLEKMNETIDLIIMDIQLPDGNVLHYVGKSENAIKPHYYF